MTHLHRTARVSGIALDENVFEKKNIVKYSLMIITQDKVVTGVPLSGHAF